MISDQALDVPPHTRRDMAATRLTLEGLVRGCRKQAEREGFPPYLLFPQYGRWLGELHADPQLVLEIARDAKLRLRVIGDEPAILGFGGAVRLPSRAAADGLTALVSKNCGRVPTDRAVRRAMAILAEHARRT